MTTPVDKTFCQEALLFLSVDGLSTRYSSAIHMLHSRVCHTRHIHLVAEFSHIDVRSGAGLIDFGTRELVRKEDSATRMLTIPSFGSKVLTFTRTITTLLTTTVPSADSQDS